MAESSPKPLVVTVPLRWGDLDMLGHVNNTRYLELAQEARVAMARVAFEGADWSMVVRRATIDFLMPLDLSSEPVTVTLTILGVGNSSFTIRHEIADRNGTVAAVVDAVMVLFDPATASARRMTDEQRAKLANYLIEEPAAAS